MMTKKDMGSCSSKAKDRVDPRIGIIVQIPSKYSSSVSETEDSNSSTTNISMPKLLHHTTISFTTVLTMKEKEKKCATAIAYL